MDGPGTKPGTLQLQSGTSPTTDLPRPISMVHIAPPPPHYSITYIYALLTYCTNYSKSDKLIKSKCETILLQYFSNAQIYNERVRRVLNFKKIKTYDINSISKVTKKQSLDTLLYPNKRNNILEPLWQASANIVSLPYPLFWISS